MIGASIHAIADAAAKLVSSGAARFVGAVSSTRSLIAGVSAVSANTYIA